MLSSHVQTFCRWSYDDLVIGAGIPEEDPVHPGERLKGGY